MRIQAALAKWWPSGRFPVLPRWLRLPAALARRAVTEFRDDHCQQMAAAISFHVLFSLFPLAIAAVGVLGLMTQSAHAQQIVTDAVMRAVPLSDTGKQQLQDLLTSVGHSAGALGLLGLVGVLWSASGVMAAIRTSLNIAWDTDARRPFVRGKAFDLLLIVSTFLLVAAALGVTVFTAFLRHGSEHLPHAVAGLSAAAGAAATVGSVLLACALLFVTFLFLYRLGPAVPTKVREIWPGALVAAVAFEAAQWGFSLYLAHFDHYDKVYGSLGAIIAFLFFVYLASNVFLLGAEVASEWPRLRAEVPTASASR